MASIVVHEVTKIINVPTMKDHSASGVTGALKNLAYGSFNNVARTHHSPHSFTNPLIGLMCTVEPLRSKSVLNVMDGMRQVWHGGPLTQVQDFIDQTGLLLVATDPVAMDTIELEAIEKKRRERGAPSLWQHDASSITTDSDEFCHNSSKNLFFRQPGHIAAAGKLGPRRRRPEADRSPFSLGLNRMMTETAKSRASDDWPTLLKNNARTGGQALSKPGSPERGLWTFRTGSSVRSAPILDDGILYVASVNGILHAIDAATGSLKWKFQAGGQVHSTPSLYAERILFGCDDGKVYAVDRHSGTKMWEVSTEAEVWASPVARDGTVFFGSADVRIYAVEAGSGHRRWTQELGGRIYSTIYAAEHQLYVGCGDGKVY